MSVTAVETTGEEQVWREQVTWLLRDETPIRRSVVMFEDKDSQLGTWNGYNWIHLPV